MTFHTSLDNAGNDRRGLHGSAFYKSIKPKRPLFNTRHIEEAEGKIIFDSFKQGKAIAHISYVVGRSLSVIHDLAKQYQELGGTVVDARRQSKKSREVGYIEFRDTLTTKRCQVMLVVEGICYSLKEASQEVLIPISKVRALVEDIVERITENSIPPADDEPP